MKRLSRREFVLTVSAAAGTLFFCTHIGPWIRDSGGCPKGEYADLDLAGHQRKKKPLLYLTDSVYVLDEDVLSDSKDCVIRDYGEMITRDIGEGWSMKGKASLRYAFVPETEDEHAEKYLSYATCIIGEAMEVSGLGNPFPEIRVPKEPMPAIIKGNNAFIVNNLFSEYIVYNTICDHDSKERGSIKTTELIRDHNMSDSYIGISESGGVAESTDRIIVLLSTSGDNDIDSDRVYSLISPVEEAFHSHFRGSTVSVIGEDLGKSGEEISDLYHAMGEWIPVEEAAAGGIANAFFPCISSMTGLGEDEFLGNLKKKAKHEKLRYLERGTLLAKSMGPQDAARLYIENPRKFRKKLLEI